MLNSSTLPPPSEELINTLGREKEAKMLRRSLTPAQAASEINRLVVEGWKISNLAKQLGITSTVIKHLNQIGMLPKNININQYLSPYWGENQSETKRQNKLSFTALGLFAAFVNSKFNDEDIAEALQTTVNLSLSKDDMVEAAHIYKLRKIPTATKTIEIVAEERGGYGTGKMEIIQQAILISARGHEFSENEIAEIRKTSENIVGPIVSAAYQKGDIVGLEFMPGKLSDAKMQELLPAEKLQEIADRIQGRAI